VTQTVSASLASPVSERDHIRGAPGAPVTLVEYGDFECPYCRTLAPILEELRQLLGDQLRLVFRHFPLASSHPHAFRAAQAAEAAGTAGRFWEMHDLLYANQEAPDDERLAANAAELGLDADGFARDLRDEVYAERVREDLRSGAASGVSGTPTLYLDGVRFDTTVGLQELLGAIRRAHPELTVAADADPAARGRRIPRVRRRSPRA
jgi:protein-disulfide isomerase